MRWKQGCAFNFRNWTSHVSSGNTKNIPSERFTGFVVAIGIKHLKAGIPLYLREEDNFLRIPYLWLTARNPWPIHLYGGASVRSPSQIVSLAYAASQKQLAFWNSRRFMIDICIALYGAFLSHGGAPKSYKSFDHDLVLKQPWWLGDPNHFQNPPHITIFTIIHNY
jgi:hypothetical protein